MTAEASTAEQTTADQAAAGQPTAEQATAEPRSSWWTGVVLYVALLVWMAQLSLLDTSRRTFLDSQAAMASLPGRMFAGVVLFAAIRHLLDGVARAVAAPGETRKARTDGMIRFSTWALVIPGWTVLLRPWVEGLVP